MRRANENGNGFRRRWGRLTESKLDRWFGEDCALSMRKNTEQIRIPVPILGAPISLCEGEVLPRMIGGAGFTDFTDYKAKRLSSYQYFPFQKTGAVAPVAGLCYAMTGRQTVPKFIADSPSFSGAGSARNNTTPGAFPVISPATGKNLFVSSWGLEATVPTTLMLCDYLWGGVTDLSITPQANTGVPTRYTGTNAAGNFLVGRVNVALGAGVPTVTMTYVNEAGGTVTGAAQTIRASAATEGPPFTAPQWMYTLNSGDMGIRNVTNFALSAASTGSVDWEILHPLGIIAAPIANYMFSLEGPQSGFNMVGLGTAPCLTFCNLYPSASASIGIQGFLEIAQG